MKRLLFGAVIAVGSAAPVPAQTAAPATTPAAAAAQQGLPWLDSMTDAYRQAIAHDGLLEAAHRGLMRCLARRGEPGQALRHYQALLAQMHAELGLPPSPETAGLYERLRRGETRSRPASSGAASSSQRRRATASTRSVEASTA